MKIAAAAERDIDRILGWSATKFGPAARHRYQSLIKRAFVAITETDPATSRDAPQLGPGIRLYHLRGSRSGEFHPPVARPRHFLVYRRHGTDLVEVLRLLHDASDLSSQLVSDD